MDVSVIAAYIYMFVFLFFSFLAALSQANATDLTERYIHQCRFGFNFGRDIFGLMAKK